MASVVTATRAGMCRDVGVYVFLAGLQGQLTGSHEDSRLAVDRDGPGGRPPGIWFPRSAQLGTDGFGTIAAAAYQVCGYCDSR